jgi:glycosyltransferase involved in cell wall biosynthesis
MRPTDQFDLFGPVDGDLSEMELALPNITHRGILGDVSAADFTGYDGFLFTSLFEGMPNIVLAMSQHAIPMVLADVGGLRDTFDDTSVHFVGHGQDPYSTAEAFLSTLDRVAKLTPSKTLTMAEAARAQAQGRHGPDIYLKNVADIFEA